MNMREKLALQRQVKTNLTTLKTGELPMRERLALQRSVKADLKRLGGAGSTPPAHKTLTARIASGEFNHLSLHDFLQKMQQAFAQDGDLAGLVQGSLRYADEGQALQGQAA